VSTDSDWITVNLNQTRPVGDITVKFSPTSSSDFKFDVQTACNVQPTTCKAEGGAATGKTVWQFQDVCTGNCKQAQMNYTDPTGVLPTSLYIRVYRDGNALSCNLYTLQITRT
jgi:hypothetical protein